MPSQVDHEDDDYSSEDNQYAVGDDKQYALNTEEAVEARVEEQVEKPAGADLKPLAETQRAPLSTDQVQAQEQRAAAYLEKNSNVSLNQIEIIDDLESHAPRPDLDAAHAVTVGGNEIDSLNL